MVTHFDGESLQQQKEHLTMLVRQGRYQEARQFARDMNHPKLNEVLKIISEVDQHRNGIMLQGIPIPTEVKHSKKVDDIKKRLSPDFPVHPNRVMRNRYGWERGVWVLMWVFGLRSLRLFQNYIKMEHTLYAILSGIIYFWIVGIFIGSFIIASNVLTTTPLNIMELIMSFIGILILPVSPYAFAFVQEPVFKQWYAEFRFRREL